MARVMIEVDLERLREAARKIQNAVTSEQDRGAFVRQAVRNEIAEGLAMIAEMVGSPGKIVR